MEQNAPPNELAREAIKRLAARKLPPTPENFRRAYLEASGVESPQALWPEAVRLLLEHWEKYQIGLTQARKREMLERVLINFASDPDQLAGKLIGLARSWAESGAATTALEGNLPPLSSEAATGQPPPVMAGEALTAGSGHLIVVCLNELSGGCRERWPDLADRAARLALALLQHGEVAGESDIASLAGLWREVLLRAEGDHEFLVGLKRLLALLFANVGELVAEDAWLAGQMATMQAMLSDQLNQHALYQAEESLKDLVLKQKQLKGSMNEAKEKLKQLISTFIARLGEMSDSTGQYNARIKGYAVRITQAEDITQLSDVIDGLSTDMSRMEEEIVHTHRELVEARSHAQEAEARIHSLERELETVSTLVREDQLTGALNRRGLDDAFTREIARATRMATPFSAAMLDIDHFKRLNDQLGHQVGDQALTHLARVIRDTLRPTDSLARYGGEEFLILLPNSDIGEAERVMQRLQRELTKQYFLHDNERVLITFSAGVAQLQPGETQTALITRADGAMYQAKAAGRNRVERG